MKKRLITLKDLDENKIKYLFLENGVLCKCKKKDLTKSFDLLKGDNNECH